MAKFLTFVFSSRFALANRNSSLVTSFQETFPCLVKLEWKNFHPWGPYFHLVSWRGLMESKSRYDATLLRNG